MASASRIPGQGYLPPGKILAPPDSVVGKNIFSIVICFVSGGKENHYPFQNIDLEHTTWLDFLDW